MNNPALKPNSITHNDGMDLARLRRDFPILSAKPHGKPLHYLDSGASSQKPQAVIDTISRLYSDHYANVHRGTYDFSERTTFAYEEARKTCGAFLNAPSDDAIVFTSGTTAAINLVAYAYGRAFLQKGDAIVTTVMEHHSNLVPWQMMRDQCDIELRYVPIHEDGSLDMEAFHKLLDDKVKLVAVAHVSNVLGTVNPISDIIRAGHAVGAKILLDGSQAVQHLPIDVQKLDVDFYAFTGHKIYGPNAIGVLYGKPEILQAMPPFFGGGDMIKNVELHRTTYADPPARFEAGTPPIAEAIGLKAALDYVQTIGLSAIHAHEQALSAYAEEALQQVPGLRIIGQAKGKAPIMSFVLDGAHPHDVATILDQDGIAVRAGHHCAEPLMKHYGISGTTRASLAVYNGRDDIDALVAGLLKAREILGL